MASLNARFLAIVHAYYSEESSVDNSQWRIARASSGRPRKLSNKKCPLGGTEAIPTRSVSPFAFIE